MQCPGQDNRWLRVELYKCPECGHEVEIFSNETKVKCDNCSSWVHKEKLPSCIDWCAAAQQCLGEERWKQLMGEKKSDNGLSD
jgi:DNA-directed RNA polymerase subunit RPC12/RpoP